MCFFHEKIENQTLYIFWAPAEVGGTGRQALSIKDARAQHIFALTRPESTARRILKFYLIYHRKSFTRRPPQGVPPKPELGHWTVSPRSYIEIAKASWLQPR